MGAGDGFAFFLRYPCARLSGRPDVSRTFETRDDDMQILDRESGP